MINILLDCTKLKDMELFYNLEEIIKYIIIAILILIPFITLIKVLYNFFSHITSRRTVRKFFLQTFLSIGLVFCVYLMPIIFSRVDEYKSNFDYCLKYTNKENLEELRKYNKEKEELKKNGIEEKYAELKNKIKENRKNLISKINTSNKNNNENRSVIIKLEENNNVWGNLEFKDGVFYINGSNEKMNIKDGIVGLNPVFSNRLNKMIEDAKEYNYQINVVIGYRNYSKVKETFDIEGDCLEKCDYLIHPNVQMYSYGISANLKFNSEDAKKWAYNNAYKYGLYFKYENIIEPAKVVYKDYPTCQKMCEVEE